MSFLSKLFGGREASVERQLRDMYSQVLSAETGCSLVEARSRVTQAIALCKKQAIAEDRAGAPTAKEIVAHARREGARDDDIKEWWDLPDLGRRMVMWHEDVVRYAAFLHALREDRLSKEDAAARVHRMFPAYGDPTDESKLHGESRPLPHELRGRVDRFRQRHGAAWIAEQVKGFPSYNAYVRHALRQGIL